MWWKLLKAAIYHKHVYIYIHTNKYHIVSLYRALQMIQTNNMQWYQSKTEGESPILETSLSATMQNSLYLQVIAHPSSIPPTNWGLCCLCCFLPLMFGHHEFPLKNFGFTLFRKFTLCVVKWFVLGTLRAFYRWDKLGHPVILLPLAKSLSWIALQARSDVDSINQYPKNIQRSEVYNGKPY